MSLGNKEMKRFDAFQQMIGPGISLKTMSHLDEPKIVHMMVDLFQSGSRPDELSIDTVRHWAEEKGWPDDEAYLLGKMCETVHWTLNHLGTIKPS